MSVSRMSLLPDDEFAGTLVGRVWSDAPHPCPLPVAIRAKGLFDLSRLTPTVSELLDLDDPVDRIERHVKAGRATRLCSLQEAIVATENGNSHRLLAPFDLQAIKAAGVTFVSSMLERVIEERAKGDPAAAAEVRRELQAAIGESTISVEPGSAQATKVKEVLLQAGLWSQYLEVGIGPDAEVFTKAQVLSAVGPGAQIGVHPESAWNNPEPEIVLACSSRGYIVGASLGNDVNLRDFEGRSALLLSKAKDNNASCAIGPFIRLFDNTFSLDDVRQAELTLQVQGPDGFDMRGASSMSRISRDPADLVAQTIGAAHQYPDGFCLFLGTMFAPTQDRGAAGQGFTHHVGDRVTISSPRLGRLINTVTTSDRAAPWTFGVRALYRALAARGLLSSDSDQR